MTTQSKPFNWNTIRNIFFATIFGILILPLIILLYFAANYKVPNENKNTSQTQSLPSNVTETPPSQTPTPPAKLELINPTTNKPTYTATEHEEHEGSED